MSPGKISISPRDVHAPVRTVADLPPGDLEGSERFVQDQGLTWQKTKRGWGVVTIDDAGNALCACELEVSSGYGDEADTTLRCSRRAGHKGPHRETTCGVVVQWEEKA